MGFRDKAFRSVITGDSASMHHTFWLQTIDDGLECLQSTGSDGDASFAGREYV
jgi:hypothetical protein